MNLLLTDVDGNEYPITAAEFFSANEDLVGTGVEDAIRGLYIGQSFLDGGGASPEWGVKRIA
jgi:hypothetical protein